MSHTCITLRTVCAYGHSVCAKLHVQCDKIFCKVAAMCLNLAFGPGHCRNSYLRAFLLFFFFFFFAPLVFPAHAVVHCTTHVPHCYPVRVCSAWLCIHLCYSVCMHIFYMYVNKKNWLFCALPLENLYMKAAAFF